MINREHRRAVRDCQFMLVSRQFAMAGLKLSPEAFARLTSPEYKVEKDLILNEFIRLSAIQAQKYKLKKDLQKKREILDKIEKESR